MINVIIITITIIIIIITILLLITIITITNYDTTLEASSIYILYIREIIVE